jgi:hypothetical protein
MDVGTGELESPGPLDASGHLFVGEMEGVQLQMRAGGRVPGRELLFPHGVRRFSPSVVRASRSGADPGRPQMASARTSTMSA